MNMARQDVAQKVWENCTIFSTCCQSVHQPTCYGKDIQAKLMTTEDRTRWLKIKCGTRYHRTGYIEIDKPWVSIVKIATWQDACLNISHTCTSLASIDVVLPSPMIRAKTPGILRMAFKKSTVSYPASVIFIASIFLFKRPKKDSFCFDVGADAEAAAAIWKRTSTVWFLKTKNAIFSPVGCVLAVTDETEGIHSPIRYLTASQATSQVSPGVDHHSYKHCGPVDLTNNK